MGLLLSLKSLFGLSSKGDRHLLCEDCHKKFVFDEGEQRFFREKGFTDPKRCPRCRKRVKARLHRRVKPHRSHFARGHHYRDSGVDGNSPYADE